MQKQKVLLEILKHPDPDTWTEMTRDDLEQILDEELSKPEALMDTGLIRELLLQLEDGVTPQKQQAAWKATARKLPGLRLSPVLQWAARIAATLIFILGLSVLTYRTAAAFNWQLLLRLMRPFTETFCLYSGDDPNRAALTSDAYGDGSKPEAPGVYASIREVPAHLQGYPARPYGVPERFTYMQGVYYGDDLSTTMTHVYSSSGGLCIFTLTLLHQEEPTTSRQPGQAAVLTQDMSLAGCQVTYTFNADATISAFWALDNAQYSLIGSISEAELALIVESTMNK
ncbi:MAG: hypothetical protein IKK57_09505 [Clostridia bacterium]|nr:hypothetical protein [Clostridia bacterium]